MQEFVIIAGLPGSGKSTIGKKLKLERGHYVVSSDMIRLALNASVYPPGSQNADYDNLEPVVWQLVEQAIVLLLKAGHNVAIDATNLTQDRRNFWKEVCHGVSPEIQISVIWCTGNWDSPSRWEVERGICEEAYRAIRKKLEDTVEVPTQDEGCKLTFMP